MSKRMFLLGFLASFFTLTFWSTLWIPFDYPSEPIWVVKYRQSIDQLFRVNDYLFIFLSISLIPGIISGYSRVLFNYFKD